jgi:hypothetical protein
MIDSSIILSDGRPAYSSAQETFERRRIRPQMTHHNDQHFTNWLFEPNT